ncbi:hypothetical protein [Roseospira visakhapatnamensis]|uniref:Uncharacterized protein n=1 Tax=Roseospira visakhapatnamensis TaxID=390880 RepID=A0A7W6RF78_9PROT|nr:hypothetical protein [Roseospira visakhapatnamensis]MBB4267444.1 hypothetical protein [Roseospira visakhapatnamensis]
MTHRTPPGIAALALAASVALAASPALAQDPGQAPGQDQPGAAMVLDTIGTTEPMVEAYTTLPEGTEIALSDEAEIEFIDLKTCDLVRVAGGMLVLGEVITHKGGTVLKREASECPDSFDLESESVPGGVVLRAMPF